jgi:hypothetical protein
MNKTFELIDRGLALKYAYDKGYIGYLSFASKMDREIFWSPEYNAEVKTALERNGIDCPEPTGRIHRHDTDVSFIYRNGMPRIERIPHWLRRIRSRPVDTKRIVNGKKDAGAYCAAAQIAARPVMSVQDQQTREKDIAARLTARISKIS